MVAVEITPDIREMINELRLTRATLAQLEETNSQVSFVVWEAANDPVYNQEQEEERKAA